MPPKKKKAKGKGKTKDKDKNATGEVGKTVKDYELELERKMKELEHEQEKRNYFQLERDKINAFWEITKNELQNHKAELRNKDREIEEQEERHQVELKVYKQKVRHLLYEQKITIDRLKIESENALKIQANEFKKKIQQLKVDKRGLKREAKEKEKSHEEMINSIKLQQDKQVTKLREEFERQLREIQLKYDLKMKNLVKDMELRSKKEIEEIEERKNMHIEELMKKHKQAFQDIKSYYNVITTNNLVLIKTLKDEVSAMKKSEANNEKLMFEIAQENKKLSEPLMVALAEVNQLRNELANYQKDKLSLKNAKSRLYMYEDRLKRLTYEHDILDQSFQQLQKERDDLYNKFEKTINDVQQKTMFKNQLLETKVHSLQDLIEKKDIQMGEIIKVSKLDDSVMGNVASNVEGIIDEKNKENRNLRFEIEKIKKAYNDMLNYYNSKFKEYGITPDESQFSMYLTTTTTQAPIVI